MVKDNPRQAVVIIHGIGEQRPMETLRGFVVGIFGSKPGMDGRRRFYSKPDVANEGFELRRYRAFDRTADSDFIEYYWQHRMPIGGWAYIFGWLWTLVRRSPVVVPARFQPIWWLWWSLVLVAVILGLADIVGWLDLDLSLPEIGGVAAAALAALGALVRSFVGDAAIYLNPGARTVETRNRIRADGVQLLERLQADPRYDRIVIVGHSLGSVIGYDILTFAWQRASEAHRRLVEASPAQGGQAAQPALAHAEQIAADPGFDPERWNAAVRALHDEARSLGVAWKVTDLVTLGSPLAHADLLLARSHDDLGRRIGERELPTAPPSEDVPGHFSYVRHSAGAPAKSVRVVDHAALFALTRWTNLYFPCRWWVRGDPVGGPIGPKLGRGIIDLAVSTPVRSGWLAHTAYWTRSKGDVASPAVIALIEALDLARDGFPTSELPDIAPAIVPERNRP